MEKKTRCAISKLQVGSLLFGALFTVMPLSAANSAKQMSKLSIAKTNVTIQSVLRDIEQVTGCSFLYNGAIVNAKSKITINVRNKSLEQVLSTVFQGSNISYKIVDNQIILSSDEAQQNVSQKNMSKVSGVVKDNTGAGIPGANVSIKGTKTGTITDIDGNYTLNVPEKSVLVFSYIGFLPHEVNVSNQKVINITLKEDTRKLDEVVVVGYTTQKKADLTGAVSSVKVEEMGDIAVTGVNHALQGKMSGVTVYQNGGAPGASASIRVRGLGTIGNNDPLYVIDGMPADNMNDLNPNDIERIDVLKDAASAAIYGSRAANGVVIIQTKKGTKSDKINVSFNSHHGFATPMKKLDLLDAEGRNMIHSEAYTNDGLKVPAYYTSDYAKVTRTNWQDQVLHNAYTGNYDLSLSGGTEKAKYNVAAGYLTQDGILRNSGYDRVNFRVNTEMNIAKNFKVGENLMISHSVQNSVSAMGSNGALSSAFQYDPSIAVYKEDGSGEYNGSGELAADIRNPRSIVDRSDRKMYRDRIFGNMFAQWDITKALVLKTDFGYDWSKWQDKWFSTRVPEAGRPSTVSELTQKDWQSTRWINTTTLKYENKFGSSKLMGLAGFSYEAYDMNYMDGRGSGFISDDVSQRYMECATVTNWLKSGREEWALMSSFARLDYSLADKYLLSFNFRTDGSSKFSKENRWGYFPSISGAWRVSEESFFQPIKDKVDNLKIRASWGKLGNQNIFDNYPTYSKVSNTNDNDGYNVVFGKGEQQVPGRYESSIPNKNIKWEVTDQLDFGLDISFLNHFDLTADYFVKTTSDVLLQVPITSLAGVNSAPWANSAEVQNKGFEFNLAYNNTIGKLKYSVYGNFSSIKNKVLSLGNGSEAIYSSSYRGNSITRTTVGDPMAHFFGYKSNGIFKTDAEAAAYVNDKGVKYQPNAKAGDLKFIDWDNNGVLNDKDRTNIGDGFPDFTYGFGFNAEYKGFDLAFFFQGVAGYKIFNALKYEGMFVNKSYNQFAAIKDRYNAVTNPNGNLPRVTVEDPNGNQSRFSDYYVENGNFLRMKNLTLGYTFKNALTKKLNLNKLRVYATAQNLFTITKYSGLDPELGETYADDSSNYGVTELAVDRGQFPQARSYVFGVNINF